MDKQTEAVFLESYQNEFNLEPIWIKRISSFKRLREIEMLA